MGRERDGREISACDIRRAPASSSRASATLARTGSRATPARLAEALAQEQIAYRLEERADPCG